MKKVGTKSIGKFIVTGEGDPTIIDVIPFEHHSDYELDLSQLLISDDDNDRELFNKERTKFIEKYGENPVFPRSLNFGFEHNIDVIKFLKELNHPEWVNFNGKLCIIAPFSKSTEFNIDKAINCLQEISSLSNKSELTIEDKMEINFLLRLYVRYVSLNMATKKEKKHIELIVHRLLKSKVLKKNKNHCKLYVV